MQWDIDFDTFNTARKHITTSIIKHYKFRECLAIKYHLRILLCAAFPLSLYWYNTQYLSQLQITNLDNIVHMRCEVVHPYYNYKLQTSIISFIWGARWSTLTSSNITNARHTFFRTSGSSSEASNVSPCELSLINIICILYILYSIINLICFNIKET